MGMSPLCEVQGVRELCGYRFYGHRVLGVSVRRCRVWEGLLLGPQESATGQMQEGRLPGGGGGPEVSASPFGGPVWGALVGRFPRERSPGW